MQLFLIRHLRTDAPKNSLLGHSDVSLSNESRKFARQNIDLYSHLSESDFPTLYFSSDLKRCTETCSLLFPTKKFQHDNRLREMNFGIHELKTWKALAREDPIFYETYMKNWKTEPFPGGESISDVLKRMKEFFRELSQTYKAQKAVAVTHSGIIRLSLHLLGRASLEEALEVKVDYGEIVEINTDDIKV